jgi:hypothetical protein
MKGRALTVAVFIALLLPLPAPAQRQGGAGRGAGTPRAGGPPARVALPRPVAQRPGGFNLNRDVGAPPVRQPAPARYPNPPARVANPPRFVRPPIAGRPPIARRPPIANPHYRGQQPWTWNHGVVWAPAPVYWGGGFWGPFALGAAAAAFGAAAYGSFDDPATNQIYPSYEVEPNSPGAQLLANYQLTQTPCGPPNLVVIFGPDGSLICADPSGLVGPGEYDLDPSNLTLVSQ